IIGTIHASKGREAEEVILALPPLPGEEDDVAEETRVLYVGATRPKRHLLVHVDPETKAYPLPSGRLWCVRVVPTRKLSLSASVEVGLNGDIDRAAGVQEPLAPSGGEARASQRLLAESASHLRSVVAHCDREWEYSAYRIELPEHPGVWIGQFTRRVQ